MTDATVTLVAPAAPVAPVKTVRKHKDAKAAKIRKLLSRGKSPVEIAKIVGTTRAYVYGVSRRTKNNPKTAKKLLLVATSDVSVKRKPGRPKKNGVDFVPTFIAQPPSLWDRIKAVFTGGSHA